MRIRSALNRTNVDELLSIREPMKSKRGHLSTQIADLATLKKSLTVSAKKAWKVVQALQDDISKIENEVHKYEKLITLKQNEHKNIDDLKLAYRIDYILTNGCLENLSKDDKYRRFINDQNVLITHIEFYKEKINDLVVQSKVRLKDIERPREEMRSLNDHLAQVTRKLEELDNERKSLEKDISKTNINIQIVGIELRKTQNSLGSSTEMEYITVKHITYLVKTRETVNSLLDYVRVVKTLDGIQAPVWYKVKEGRDLTLVKDDRNETLEKVYQDYKAKLS